MRNSVLVLMLLASACHRAEDLFSISAAAPAPHLPPRIAPGVPHGDSIVKLAITEKGDAAVTADGLGAIRVWPTLDGKRPPVPLAAAEPEELSIAHAGDELLVAILDEAGNAWAIRVGLDGAVHARLQLPSEVGYDQILAIDQQGVLARRRDQVIEWFDRGGVRRGSLAANAGEQLGEMAVRGGKAAVLVRDSLTLARGEAEVVRWIDLGGALAWGVELALPEVVSLGTLAIAPDHHRIATLDPRAGRLAVFDLDARLSQAGGPVIAVTADSTVIGFVDDDHVAVINGQVQWWQAPSHDKVAVDPWDVTPSGFVALPNTGSSGAIGDLAITPAAGGLAIVPFAGKTRYLSWDAIAVGTLYVVGNRIAINPDNVHAQWVDDQLAPVGETALPEQTAVVLDARHVLTERNVANLWEIDLVDVDHEDKPIMIGSYPQVAQLSFAHDLHQLGVVTMDKIDRFAIDLDKMTATRLRPLWVQGAQAISMGWLVDPARAHGVIAVALASPIEGDQQIVKFREPAAATGPIEPFEKIKAPLGVIGIDELGTVYTPMSDNGATMVVATHDGARRLVVTPHDISLVEGTTHVWSRPLFPTLAAAFLPGDRKLVVHTGGGLVMLDAATGDVLARACAWGFGLHDQAPAINTFGQPPVCEDTAR